MPTYSNKILVVDDEGDVLECLILFLESHGYSTTGSRSCKQAIDIFRKEDFFLVITDIAMPEMDGYEITNEMSKIKPDTCFAYMTGFGYNPRHTLVKIRETRECPCIFKPFNHQKLLDTVKAAFGRYDNTAVRHN